ncbi:hypothetical protein A7U60_g2348 [Sanghuangporus baumii]|uniref:Zinc-finger domain-containing protein n=1 Tax=Sanghuangporus baumii TaxID=108892 RepID=A0A9Q5I3B5_SANBA|nr:hypothetical protein A7U60_g2348 [Sanghuangporus baumii]
MTLNNSTPLNLTKPTPSTPKPSASKVASGSLKRKLDVFVEIPRSPHNGTTPKFKRPSGSSSSSSVRRKSQVFVEIPPSPMAVSRLKGTPASPMKASPLSTKAFNMNKLAESPNKKCKLSDVAKPLKQEAGENDRYPSGFFSCHQCRRKNDLSLGVQCTVLFRSRCKSVYCKSCLRNRYGLDIEAIKRRPAISNGKHVFGVPYHWTCPKCADKCNCNYCRKAKGLPALGRIIPPQQATELKTPARAGTFDMYKARGSSNAAGATKEAQNSEVDLSKPRAPRVKKPIRHPRWTELSIRLSREQAEDRFYLREFILRFSPLLKIGVTYLEELDLFDKFSCQCARAVLNALLDLLAADADSEDAKLIRDTLRKITGSSANPATLWARLQLLRDNLPEDFFVVPIPDPGSRPSFAEEESQDEVDPPQRTSSRIKTRRGDQNESVEEVLNLDSDVTHALQLLPCIIALCECALQGPSIRAEIAEGADDARGENRAYFADVRKENERWAQERISLGWGESKVEDEDKGDVAKGKERDTERDKAYRAALAKHKDKLAALGYAHLLELQGAAPRFGPLGRDSQGRVYYASSAFRRKDKRAKAKVPDEEEREEMKKWGWFLAIWGRGAILEREERWWGFYDPAEIRQLAKWLAAAEGVDGKDSAFECFGEVKVKREDANNFASGGSGSDGEINFGQGPPTQAQVKALVKSLNEYADLLEWRIDGGEAQS